MGLLRGLLSSKPDHECRGAKTYLRAPQIEDFVQWRDLRKESRSFLEPWEPTWQDDELLLSSYRRRINQYARLAQDDKAYPFFIFDGKASQLMGAITVANVRRGVAEMATLGYWTGAPFANTGVMKDALEAVTTFVRTELELHRLEAACLPSNTPSIHLLRGAGFDQEGLARNYIKINGRWEDHILWGKLLG